LLDIKFVRESPETVKENLSRRGNPELLQMLENLIGHDREWRRLLTKTNELRHERRKITNEIALLKKAGEGVDKHIEKGREVDAQIVALDRQVEEHKQYAHKILMGLPNLLHETVPYGNDEKDNVQVRLWGKPPEFDFRPKNHLEIAQGLDLIEVERGGKIAGHGYFYLKEDLALLDLALQRFGVDSMLQKGYRLIEPPFMMRRRPYEGVTDLADFENVMYKIENEDLYLIATAEHPIAAMFMNEVLLKDEMPMKLVGISPCFRKEVGTHGKYTKGLFRMHQFNKVEQFIFCLPANSWAFHEEMQRNAEELYQALGLHFQVVNVCTGDIGTVPAKKYDIDAWMADGIYREVGSNSNCTDYQARRLGIRYRDKEGQPPRGFVHTLNSTAIATSRAMVAILEQYQQKDGSCLVPRALTKYAHGLEKLELH